MIGKLDKNWVDDCRINGNLENWITQALNCQESIVSDDGSVWVSGPMQGHWLSQDAIDRLVEKIDDGL